MRLYSAKVPQVAAEMVAGLVAEKAIESEQLDEVALDIQSVLSQYIRDEQEVHRPCEGPRRRAQLAAGRGRADEAFGGRGAWDQGGR